MLEAGAELRGREQTKNLLCGRARKLTSKIELVVLTNTREFKQTPARRIVV
jgi:hypothetical protein